MIKKFASLLRRIVGRITKMADQIYGTIGAVAMTVGFSLLAVSVGENNSSLAYASIISVVLGIIMVSLAYLGAKKKESIEREIKLIEYNNATKMIDELREVNKNLIKLISNKGRYKNERNKREQK